MPSANYIVKDTVRHIHEESEYRPRRSFSRTLRKLKTQLWIFLTIVLLSGGLGYVAVYLPESMPKASSGIPSLGGMDAGALKEKYNSLTEEQKAELKSRFGGMAQ